MLLIKHRNTTSLAVGSLVRRYALQLTESKHWFNVYLLLFLKPPPPGQKRVREDWEMIWYVGMFGGMGVAGVLHYYKPDTRYVLTMRQSFDCSSHLVSIQTWALAEAKARMEARGEKYKYEPASS
jgi:ESSS subunit of NADH:ubiquinone oxidoreductase (complex I)